MLPRHALLRALLTSAFLALSVGATYAHRGPAPQSAFSGTLTIFDYGGSFGPPEGPVLIKGYERLHPGVQIKTVPFPGGNFLTYFNAELDGGTSQDIMTLSLSQQIWKDIHKGLWLDLTPYAQAPDPYVPGNKHWIDLIAPNSRYVLPFVNGHIYALTTSGFDVGFVYNKTIFAKLGLGIPQTWAQLLGELQKIKAAGYIPMDFSVGDTGYGDAYPSFITIVEDMVMDGSIKRMDTDHNGVVNIRELVQGIRDGVYSAHNADFQEGWKLFKDLAQYFQFGAAAADTSLGFNLWKTGRVGVWFTGDYAIPSLNKVNVPWGDFVVPQITPATSRFATPGLKGVGAFGACCGWPWAIPVTTQKRGHLAMAIDFIDYVSVPSNNDPFSVDSGVLSIEPQATVPAQFVPFVYAQNHLAPTAFAELALPPAFVTARARLLLEYVSGRMSLAQAMSEMQAEMDSDAALAAKWYWF
jgi:ABC-type glycerol-3-phosphate transport system substrate-binding protein